VVPGGPISGRPGNAMHIDAGAHEHRSTAGTDVNLNIEFVQFAP